MPVLNIFSINDTKEENLIAALAEGDHLIGRGDLLKVSDKRVSRNHGIIKISNDKITLTSLHINPCFFKAAQGNTLIVLKQNEENELNDGDQFAFLPDDYWFTARILKVAKNPENGKRNSDEELCSSMSSPKRARTSINNTCITENSNQEDVQIKVLSKDEKTNQIMVTENPLNEIENSEILEPTQSNDLEENQTIDKLDVKEEIIISYDIGIHDAETDKEDDLDETEKVLGKIEEIKQESNESGEESIKIKIEPLWNVDQVKQEDSSSGADNQQNVNNCTNINANNPSTSTAPGRRDRCWYGAQCYRKNPLHLAMFSHPNDADYESDPNDDRPFCPYGSSCYRKNPKHRNETKHSGIASNQPNKPSVLYKLSKNNKKVNKRKKIKKTQNLNNGEGTFHDFSDDGTEDEYLPSNFSGDSDDE